MGSQNPKFSSGDSFLVRGNSQSGVGRQAPLPPGYFWRGYRATSGKRTVVRHTLERDWRERWLGDYAAWLVERGWDTRLIVNRYAVSARKIDRLGSRWKFDEHAWWADRMASWRVKPNKRAKKPISWRHVAGWSCRRWDWPSGSWVGIIASYLDRLLAARAAGWPLVDGKSLDRLVVEHGELLKPAGHPTKKPTAPAVVAETVPVNAPPGWFHLHARPMLLIHELWNERGEWLQ